MKLSELKPNEAILKQPYSLAWAKMEYGLIETRMFMSLMYLIQNYMLGNRSPELSNIFGKIEKNQDGDYIVKFVANTLLGLDKDGRATSRNNKAAMEAIKAFATKPIYLYSSETKSWREEEFFMPLVRARVDAVDDKSIITGLIHKDSWKVFAGFLEHHAKVDMSVVMKLNNRSSIRMYQLLAGLGPECDKVKISRNDMMGVCDVPKKERETLSYLNQKCLNAAIKDLNEIAPFSFDYELTDKEYSGDKGAPRYSNILIRKRYIDDAEIYRNETVRMVKEKGLAAIFSWQQLGEMLKHFTEDELVANAGLFGQLIAMGMDVAKETRRLAEKAADKKNPKGWIISILKKNLE